MELVEGLRLDYVYAAGKDLPGGRYLTVADGWELHVRFQAGQMSGVPWVECRHYNHGVRLINCATAYSLGRFTEG